VSSSSSENLPAEPARAVAATARSTAPRTSARVTDPAAKKAAAKKAAVKTASTKEDGIPAKKAAAAKKAPAKKAVSEAGLAIDPKTGKPRALDEVDESDFQPDAVKGLEKELTEDQGFIVSEADETDEPEQQVMVAGATADPVKDYLKQIGKVPLLNAEQEVELAKRIEAGLFARSRSPTRRPSSRRRSATSTSGSPRTAGAPRTTCSRPTCAWWCRWPSATPAAACCSWT